MFFNFWQNYQVMKDHSEVIKKHFWMIQSAKKRFSGLRVDGSTWYCIWWENYMFSNIWQHYQVMKDHSKVSRKHFWMIQSAKNEVFGHFLEFGLLVRLDIAYFDGTKCFLTFGNDTRWWRIIQKSQKCIFEGSKEPKKRFLTIFWGLVCWINLISHIVIVLNVF